MKDYCCSRCGYTTSRKSNLKNHFNRKIICQPILLDIPLNKENIDKMLEHIEIEKETDYNCVCGKGFEDEKNFNKHSQNCDKFQIEDLKKKLAEAKTSTNTTNIINDNSTTNNIIFQITPYNDPNLDGAEKYYLLALRKIFMSVPTIIEYVHFNTEFPENQNICIKNYRTKMAKVFNGKEWKTMDEDRLLDELIDTYERLLEDWAEDNPKRMQYIERYKEIKDRDGKAKVYKDLKDEVKKLIYDKRDMIKIKN